MSKSLAAGLRVAFLIAPKPFLKPLAQAVLNTIWMTPPLNSELASIWIGDGTADRIVKAKRAEAARRYMVACDALEGFRFRGKPNGFFIWLTLPDPWTGRKFEQKALEAGINVFGAEKFIVGETPVPAAARISLTGTRNMDDLKNGLALIRDMLCQTP